MSILVTGSAGHLGEALMRLLRSTGRPAVGLDVQSSAYTDVVGSVTDHQLIGRLMADTRAVIHAATLHKPHLATHPRMAFVDTNIGGTLTLLEAASANRVVAFVYTSTTSAFGSALTPAPAEPAAWITETVTPVPRNIYGVTKTAAESLCELSHRTHGLAVIILRASRFFPEEDDVPAVRGAFDPENVQANELLYRRADIEDVANAHLLAIERAPRIGFGRYIVSATTPFQPEHLAELRADAGAVVRRLFPDCEAIYGARGWLLFPSLDRVYVNALARAELGWRPQHDFRRVLDRLASGAADFRSELARAVGAKGYNVADYP